MKEIRLHIGKKKVKPEKKKEVDPQAKKEIEQQKEKVEQSESIPRH